MAQIAEKQLLFSLPVSPMTWDHPLVDAGAVPILVKVDILLRADTWAQLLWVNE